MKSIKIIFTISIITFLPFNCLAIWDGKTIEEPKVDTDGVYIIDSEAKLAGLAQFSYAIPGWSKDKSFKQTCGLDLSNKTWTPIGSSSSPFAGNYDGGGFSIKGLMISSRSNFVGLFSYNSGSIKNVNLSGSVMGDTYIGGIVGDNKGIISDCNINVSIDSYLYSFSGGGVAGKNEKIGTINNCIYSGTTKISNNGTVVALNVNFGGITSENDGLINNCINKGEISVSSKATYSNTPSIVSVINQVGGICVNNKGEITNSSNTMSIENISAGNSITSNDGKIFSYTGGITAINSGKIYNCETKNTISGSTTINARYWYLSKYLYGNDATTESLGGGICAKNTGNIIFCRNNSTVKNSCLPECWDKFTISIYSGGICGINTANIIGCSNTNNIHGNGSHTKYSDAGFFVYGSMKIGGICGSNEGVIAISKNSSNIHCSLKTLGSAAVGFGGITGYNKNGKIISSFSYGDVKDIYIENSLHTTRKGGVIGVNLGTNSELKSVYYDLNTSSCSDTDKGIGIATEILKSQIIARVMNNDATGYDYQWKYEETMYPEIIENENKIPSSVKQITYSPSISGGKGFIQIEQNQTENIAIYDLTGKVILKTTIHTGVNNIPIEKPGIYIVFGKKVCVY